MMLSNDPWSMLRFGLVFLTWSIVTWNYCYFSHSLHNRHHVEPPHGHGDSDPHDHGHHFDPKDHDHHGEHEDHHHHGDDHRHGRGAFEFDLSRPGFFTFGLALPLVFLTVLSLIWNPSTSTKGTATKKNKLNLPFNGSSETAPTSQGEVNVQKWTLIWFLLPLLLVMLDGAWGSHMSQSQGQTMGWDLYIRICMSLMSPSGYAATWALALFLIPVTKHSPILDWLCVTPVQALAFHRVAGWTSFWNSVLHGYLHLRHLMDVLNPGHMRPWYQQLKILLVPSSWECLRTQHPLEVFWGRQDPLKGGASEDASQCWLALVNATGMISVLAFVVLAATSLPQVRRYSYTLFYRVHIPAAWIMLIMAIWHYPTCALVLIPNIIYYLSFNVPVYMAQVMEYFENRKKNMSPLVETNLIEGGSIELVFATAAEESRRHETRFARIYCPKVSPLSHPFSVFSREGLKNSNGAGNDNGSTSSVATISVLLKPTGPFTEGMTKALFSIDSANDETTTASEGLSEPLVASPPSPMIQFDSFYAGTFDWTDRAMIFHDEILLVAGGVGIVPFLEFLPSLQERILADTSTATASDEYPDHDTETLEESTPLGPKCIHLHWFCREVGLASYIYYEYLQKHVQESWESNPACQGRLKINLHLTSQRPTPPSSSSSPPEEIGEEILSGVANLGVVENRAFTRDIRLAQDARFTQSKWLGLLLPGSFMVLGTMLHWWWYEQYILDDKFRDDNLIIRSHSIIFTLALAMVISIITEHILRKADHHGRTDITLVMDSDNEVPNSTNSVLSISKGRPPIDTVISDVIGANRPGVYSCGPRALMESVEGAIRQKRSDCAFYCEDSEM